jgi:glycosyltransferase involved in cell wall biosynthesis
VARLGGAPHVLHTVHGFLFHDRIGGLHRAAALAAERWTARWCDHLLFQVEEDLVFAREHGFKAADRLHLVGNGVDPARFDPHLDPDAGQRKRGELGWGTKDLVVGTVGRVVEEKGYLEFFDMAGRLARQRDDVRFLVVGLFEPEQSDAVDPQALVRQHGIADRCVILQGRDDMAELYAAMDVFVLASHREGLSRSLLEATAMARPAVVSDIRGSREIVVDGLTGRLTPVRDAQGLAETVGGLLADVGRRQMGEAGRARVLERYTEDRVARNVSDCYEQVLRTGAQDSAAAAPA